MSEKNESQIKDEVISLIKSGQTKMKPRWHFWLSSLALASGFTGVVLLLIFLFSLMTFTLRSHGPMGAVRYQQLVGSFPWWALFLAVVGLIVGFKIMQQYRFSYHKNFLILLVASVLALMLAGWLIDYSGLDNLWLRRGPMKKIYQLNTNLPSPSHQPGWRFR
jgi:hypothetical protein